ncbi:MAG: hypothetical protein AAF628_22220 [Planctomycetota bacterium]
MIRRALLGLATALPLAAQAPDQATTDPLYGLRPFRNPQENVATPQPLFRNLQLMVNRIEAIGADQMRFDEDGREVCDDPTWQRTREKVLGQLFNMATVFGLVMRDSRHPNDRRLAAYGAFLVDRVDHVFDLMKFFPGEPVRETREAALRRSIAFLRVHWPKNVEPDDGAVTDQAAEQAQYQVQIEPFAALMAEPDPRDQAQGLWFLKELCGIRDNVYPALLALARPRLGELLTSADPLVRQEARGFLQAADPEHREPPKADDNDALLAWSEAVLYDVFPPIRRVNEGRTDLFPSADLDQLVKVGRDALQGDAIGSTEQGRLQPGLYYRGFRVTRLPEPLDRLGIPVDAVITAVNGTPVTSGPDLLKAIETWLEHRHVLMVEFLVNRQSRAIEFRIKREQ